ncbi:hypothetical protein SKAU_G00162880 [Synaphobranchus kaupii]|uniref:Uncharacterized protein n=1 Tax=Synaphobranchus kaupii TaxID=118154 RepID=A0A9Q1IZK5_SYNKA|nr:hypothetical protein SKAU_G00162880 [Synaphobranchus kaupii]
MCARVKGLTSPPPAGAAALSRRLSSPSARLAGRAERPVTAAPRAASACVRFTWSPQRERPKRLGTARVCRSEPSARKRTLVTATVLHSSRSWRGSSHALRICGDRRRSSGFEGRSTVLRPHPGAAAPNVSTRGTEQLSDGLRFHSNIRSLLCINLGLQYWRGLVSISSHYLPVKIITWPQTQCTAPGVIFTHTNHRFHFTPSPSSKSRSLFTPAENLPGLFKSPHKFRNGKSQEMCALLPTEALGIPAGCERMMFDWVKRERRGPLPRAKAPALPLAAPAFGPRPNRGASQPT